MNLSKAFDTINSDLLLAKLRLYGFSLNAVKLMYSYLKNRKQQVIAGVSQGSIDGPLLFNLFINDLLFFIQYCTLNNYTDDKHLFSMGKNKDEISNILSSDFSIVCSKLLVLWKLHGPKPRKRHFMCLGKDIDDTET